MKNFTLFVFSLSVCTFITIADSRASEVTISTNEFTGGRSCSVKFSATPNADNSRASPNLKLSQTYTAGKYKQPELVISDMSFGGQSAIGSRVILLADDKRINLTGGKVGVASNNDMALLLGMNIREVKFGLGREYVKSLSAAKNLKMRLFFQDRTYSDYILSDGDADIASSFYPGCIAASW